MNAQNSEQIEKMIVEVMLSIEKRVTENFIKGTEFPLTMDEACEVVKKTLAENNDVALTFAAYTLLEKLGQNNVIPQIIIRVEMKMSGRNN